MTRRDLVLFSVVLCVLRASAVNHVRADEPGYLSKDRWAKLTEVEFAELKSADDLFRRKQWKAARSAFEKFSALRPKSDVASYCMLMMAEVTRLSGKPNLAVSDFQFVRDLAPESDDAKWAHLRIAQCHRAAGDVEKALVVYGEIAAAAGNHPTAFWAIVEQAQILEIQQKWPQRAAAWEQLIERFGKNRIDKDAFARAVHGLARHRLTEGNAQDAYRLLLMTSKEADAQTALVESAKSVIGDLRKQKDGQARQQTLADSICAQAWAWLKENKDRPGHQQLVATIAAILVEVGKPDDAVKQAMEARKTYGDARWTIELAASLLKGLNRTDDAIRQASDARRIHKDDDWTLNLYATLVWSAGDHPQALAAWDRMKDRKYALTVTSDMLVEVGKTTEAIERRRKISELDPAQAGEVFMWVGKTLEKIGKYDAAIAEYRQAMNEPANLYAIAACHSRAGRHKESIAQYGEIGAAFDNETPNALYCIALEYEKLNQADTAINLLRRICRTYPKTKSASQAHVRLQSKYKIDETLGGSEGEEKP